VRILGGILVAAAVWFPASAAPRATVLSSPIKLALPAPDRGAVYEVDVTLKLPAGVHLSGVSGVPFNLQATNQSSVPSYIRSAARIVKTSSLTSYRVFVAVNAPKGKVPFRTLADDKTLDIEVNAPPPYVKVDAKVQPGDKCSDLLAMGKKALADVVIIGASPSEGKTIEKFTEGADPHCKKPPPTTTTKPKSGPCDAVPLPQECRYDLAVEVNAPETAQWRSHPAEQRVKFRVEVVVTNEGTATSDPAGVSVDFSHYHAVGTVVPATGCKPYTSDGGEGANCAIPALSTGSAKHFHLTITLKPSAGQYTPKDKAYVLASAGANAATSRHPSCDAANEVKCENNHGDSVVILIDKSR
jgi:hypothetical protein